MADFLPEGGLSPYRRDVDEIIHSKAYSRYVDKTQVAYLVSNDHITYRGLHVQLVSHFARRVAEQLGLDLHLVEAIALGHDVGHPPFGHEGETYLSAICQSEGLGCFSHSLQSCRLLEEIEPCALSLEVLDGFLTHDGGSFRLKMEPLVGKSLEEHLIEREMKRQNPESILTPATLEGCLVKICDTVSYLARDLEDGIQLKLISRDDVPPSLLGRTQSEILKKVREDLVQESDRKSNTGNRLGCIALSFEVLEALKELRRFNFERIYFHPSLKKESKKIERGYRLLYDFLSQDLEQKKEESVIFQEFLVNKSDRYRRFGKQCVIDYIAGMTDHFFLKSLHQIFMPTRIDI
ncbi:MAG: putative deoxyguanosinetriphosphate triphosphohydrolase [Chlamydiales bacterium]|jgi:dGTPase|nr:putative deoxyguanosinetriphosphate triphosphohydrolase [Chlamydiales bacterium]